MLSQIVYNIKGEKVDNIELNDNIFGIESNDHLIYMAVKSYLAANRVGTQKAKTRAEVRGGGRKPLKQKGTGHARQGSIRSPQWKGGGVVFAPVPRDYSFKINKKEKKLALFSSLSNKYNEKKIKVLDDLSLERIKTKDMKNILDNLNIKNALICIENSDKNIVLSSRNIKNIKVSVVQTINVYNILKYDTLLFTKNAIKNLEEVYL